VYSACKFILTFPARRSDSPQPGTSGVLNNQADASTTVAAVSVTPAQSISVQPVVSLQDIPLPQPSALVPMDSEDNDVLIIEPNIPLIDLCNDTLDPPLVDLSGIEFDVPQVEPFKLDCPICFQSFEPVKCSGDLQSTPCGHIFCKPCILQSITLNPKCPICKRQVTASQIHPIFLGSGNRN
jgi:hypothetical protein